LIRCFVLALFLLGCDSVVLPWDQVQLLTDPSMPSVCYLSNLRGVLAFDSKYGTTADGIPLMWPQGYTARRNGAEIEVIDTKGAVRAITGREYDFSGAWYEGPPVPGVRLVWLTC
jgi:hypothetical protein